MSHLLFYIFFIISFSSRVNCVCGGVDKYYNARCNDMEMFEQCKLAQNKINIYCDKIIKTYLNESLYNSIPDLECERHIHCYCENYYKCQNLDSYDKCMSASNKLSEFIERNFNGTLKDTLIQNKPTIKCFKISDNYPHDYSYCDYRYVAPTPTPSSSSNNTYLLNFIILIILNLLI
jgi:hypothetical protein